MGAGADDGGSLDGFADDVQADVEDVDGTPGNDTITGTAAANILYGSSGDDVLDGRGGPDVLDGSGGTDTVTYVSRAAAVVANLDGAANDGESGEGDTITTSVENLTGGSGADRLTGNDLANVLTGGAGADKLDARGGNDTLMLRDGARDMGYGGDGQDKANLDAGTDATTGVETTF